jgi:hypothetical protein
MVFTVLKKYPESLAIKKLKVFVYHLNACCIFVHTIHSGLYIPQHKDYNGIFSTGSSR